MYGLVNKAIEQMVCAQLGPTAWEDIKRRAGVTEASFLSLQSYPDMLTYKLVDAASAVTGTSAEQILRSFGRYWTLYTATEGYGELMRLTGATLREFLHNLDAMHTRVGLSYQELRPPSFRCSDAADGALDLHYYSDRQGLAPMVVGLLEGLAERFQTPIGITLIQSREQGDDHEVFRLVFKES